MIELPDGGLYLIADTSVQPPADLVPAVERALAGGARVLQLRDKGQRGVDVGLARELQALCRVKGVPFLINDDVAMAERLGADGVHLGQDDTPVDKARQRLPAEAIIGATCHNSLALAAAAVSAGASYLAFGSFFPSRTKPQAVRAPASLLVEARRRHRLPLVAIGGITPELGAGLIRAGANFLAVARSVLEDPDPRTAAEQFNLIFLRPET